MKFTRALRTLWKRASWWRFSILSAITLTLIFLLFPPEQRTSATNALPALAADVKYTAPTPTSPSTVQGVQPQAVAKPSVATQPPVANAASTTPAATKTAAPVKAAVMPPAPQVAQIAMANATPSDTLSGIDPTQMSKTAHGSIVVKGFSVQLPPGEWMSLANGTIKGKHDGELLILGRIEHKKLLGLVQIVARRTVDPSTEEFPVLPACVPGGGLEDLSVHSEADTANVEISCWLVNHLFTPPLAQWANKSIKLDGMFRMAAGDLAAKGVTYDQDYVEVNLVRQAKWGLLQVKYDFNPSIEGITSASAMSYEDTDWAVNRIKHFPDKQAYVQKIEAWGSNQWAIFKSAFDEAEKG